MKYFVWEPSASGPVGAIWHDLLKDGAGKQRATLGKPVELLEGDKRTIEELKGAYPYHNEAKP